MGNWEVWLVTLVCCLLPFAFWQLERQLKEVVKQAVHEALDERRGRVNDDIGG